MKIYRDLYGDIISPENLFAAWATFKEDKRNKIDVARFERHIEENIFELHRDLKNKTYRHGFYEGFYIHDPKQRHIHKASVRDRILHHAVFSVVNPIFEETFIPTSFSCRVGLGTRRGVDAAEKMLRYVNLHAPQGSFALKCDVRKFFDSVDHEILISILEKRIKDEEVIWLLKEIIGSYPAAPVRERERERDGAGRAKGIPIGNLTSQLFANVYMNEFDQFMKHTLKVKNYVRYTDDFMIMSVERAYLENLLPRIAAFLKGSLALDLHPKKIILQPFRRGVDFLGYVTFPNYRIVRTKTRRRMFKKMKTAILHFRAGEISKEQLEASLRSYLGVLSHANAERRTDELKNLLWFLA